MDSVTLVFLAKRLPKTTKIGNGYPFLNVLPSLLQNVFSFRSGQVVT